MTANVFRRFFKRGLALLAVVATATAQAEPARAFAAPDSPGVAATGAAGHLVQTTLALLFVLALVFALAWFSRRLRTAASAGVSRIEVLAQTALGTKERAVLVKVGNAQLLLGVAPGSICTLHVLAGSEIASLTSDLSAGGVAAPTNFADLLRRSLGRS